MVSARLCIHPLLGQAVRSRVSLAKMTTTQTWVQLLIHVQLCWAGFPAEFRVTAFHPRFTRAGYQPARVGEVLSPQHLRGGNCTHTKAKLSNLPGPSRQVVRSFLTYTTTYAHVSYERTGRAPSILVGVKVTRSPSRSTWSREAGWRLTRMRKS